MAQSLHPCLIGCLKALTPTLPKFVLIQLMVNPGNRVVLIIKMLYNILANQLYAF